MTEPQEWTVVPIYTIVRLVADAAYENWRLGYDTAVRAALAAAPSPETDAALVERVAKWIAEFGEPDWPWVAQSDLHKQSFRETARELLTRVIPGREE